MPFSPSNPTRRTALSRLARFGALAASGFAGAARAQPSTRPVRVVASFSILGDMAREIAGDAAEVSSLVGPDADAHAYAPAPADARRLKGADLVIVNGLRFEGWVERLVAASGYKGPVLVATRGITPRTIAGSADPHAWQSLLHARSYVENIRVGLRSVVAPAQAANIDARAASYLQRIEQLDREAKARFAAVPADERRVISSHDAFGYLGASYGIEFISPQGRSTDSEASAADVARVIRQIREQRARAMFVENISDPRLVERIAREAGVAVGGTLYSDALSAPGTPADTYLRMYSHNVDMLATALLRGMSMQDRTKR